MSKLKKIPVIVFSVIVFLFLSFSYLIAALVGDINSDGKVDIADIGILIDNYALSPLRNSRADLNGDGRVSIVDVGLIIDNYGRTETGSGNATYDQVNSWIDSYKASHTGNGGKDWDINALSPSQLAANPEAQRLANICGPGQRPVIPKIAWEYGGSDHQWINPQASALVYCVYIPTTSYNDHWRYDPVQDRVTADVYVLFPNQNPCKNLTGRDQVISCLGDPTNSEILVDTISLNDGIWAGTPDLSLASTSVNLILPNGQKVFLLLNI